MAFPARNRLAFALALLLALGAAWIGFSGPRLRTPQLPPGDVTPLADSPVAEHLESAELRAGTSATSQTGTSAGQACSAPSERAAVPVTQAPASTRNRVPPARPIEGDRLVFAVRDARLRPVTWLESVDLEYALGAAPPTMSASLASEDGTFECAVRPFRGTIRVHSTSFGDATAAFPAPEDGESRAEIVLSCYASIVGRVEHGGRPVVGAIVCLETVNAGASAWEARLGFGEPPETCRWVRGDVETDSDGAFLFALERPGEYVLVARHDPEGAVTSAPMVVADTQERTPIVLELAPASRAEIRWIDAPELERFRVLTLGGENGLLLHASVAAKGAVGSFACLPAGTYVLPRPLAGFSDAPVHFEVDGSAQTVVQRELSGKPASDLALTYETAGARTDARLYHLGCHADLVGEARLGPGPCTLEAGDAGAHLLVLEQRGAYGRTVFRRMFRITLSPGRNEFAPRPVELTGRLLCFTYAGISLSQVDARFVLDDGSVVYVPLYVDRQASREASDRRRTEKKLIHAAEASTPVGTCDLVRRARDGLEILQRDVHVGAGEPTRVTLSAGSAAGR